VCRMVVQADKGQDRSSWTKPAPGEPRATSPPYRLRSIVPGLNVIEDCVRCPVYGNRPFCNLPEPLRERLEAISSWAIYKPGALLFVEGQESNGVYILCNGRVKLSSVSSKGRELICRIAEAGEIIGLPGTLSSKPRELTAETLEPTQAKFVRRTDFLAFLNEHNVAAWSAVRMLTGIYYRVLESSKNMGLSGTMEERLARFLLERSERPADQQLQMKLKHHEIAAALGTSRETVTRLLSTLKGKQLIGVSGSVITVKNRTGLEQLLDG